MILVLIPIGGKSAYYSEVLFTLSLSLPHCSCPYDCCYSYDFCCTGSFAAAYWYAW